MNPLDIIKNQDPALFEMVERMRTASMEDGALSKKHKLLIAIAIDAAHGADALIVPTEWKEFRMPDWKKLKSIMHHHLVIDGRNIYNSEELATHGFDYHGIGQR